MTVPNAPETSTVGLPVVRISGAQSIVAAIPHLLGFEPEQSLVLLCLNGPRGRVGPVGRIDLPDRCAEAAIIPLVECARAHADETLIVCFHRGHRPSAIDVLTAALHAHDIPVSAVFSVSDGRIRDAHTPQSMRRDPGVELLTADSRQALDLRSASALRGRSPLPSRASLMASISPTSESATNSITRLIGRALRETPCETARPQRVLDAEHVAHLDAIIAEALSEYGDHGEVSGQVAAQIIALTQQAAWRDAVAARSMAGHGHPFVGLLTSVAAQCPDRYCAQICTVLAAVAYRAGQGALANCALDRALSVDSDHRMANLLRSLIQACIPPEALDVLADIPMPG